MKKPFFNKGLYLEGLRQNRLIGILFTVINTVIAVLSPILSVVEANSFPPENNPPESIHFFAPFNVLYVLVFALLAPVLTMHLFSFLNKRSTSDFYHSLPHTRLCLFISYTLSIFTWIIIAFTVQAVASILTISLFPDYFTLINSTILPTFLSIFAMAFLVTATFLIAMSLTGTSFNNIVIAGIILLLPRFAVFLMDSVITASFPQSVEGRLFPLFGNRYNLITSLIFGGMDYDSYLNSVFGSASAIIYTFVLALIYFVIAAILFVRRKSEMAGSAASGRTMQAVFRIIVCMTVCILPCMIVFSYLVSDSYVDYPLIIVLYLIALIVFFVYEAITTKKWKNLLLALPSLGIVVLLNIAIIAGMYGIYCAELNFTPKAKDIDEFSLISDAGETWNDYQLSDYVFERYGDISITEPQLISYVADALKEDVNAWKESEGRSYIYESRFEPGKNLPESYKQITVRIKTGILTKYRYIHIPEPHYNAIIDSLKTNPDMRSIIMNLPSYVKGTGRIMCGGDWLNIRQSRFTEIYNTFREEIRQCDFDTWYYECMAGNSGSSFSFDTVLGGRAVRLTIYTSPTQTPKTNQMIEEDYIAMEEKAIGKYRTIMNRPDDGKMYNPISYSFLYSTEGSFLDFSYRYIDGYTEEGRTDEESKENLELLTWLMDNAASVSIPKEGDILLNCCLDIFSRSGDYLKTEDAVMFTVVIDAEKAKTNPLFESVLKELERFRNQVLTYR